jgi:hypothetical protein|nr:MAG TPA: PORTAL PROTEIN [Caudoviricetes sp.]
MTLIPVLAELSEGEQEALARMWRIIESKAAKNDLLDVYYDGHRAFHDLGISIPPQMSQVRAALGWPQKAVSMLARKHRFEGFTLGGNLDPYDVGETLERSSFTSELSMCISAAYKQGCAFLTVLPGDTRAGEPEVMVQARSARWTTGLFDPRTRVLKAALAITSTRSEEIEKDIFASAPTGFILFLPDVVVQADRTGGAWQVERYANRTGRVLVEPLAYDPQLGRRFGRSRITREVRYLTDAAIRTLVRTETSAEFFSSPQRWIVGADPEAFQKASRWSATLGRVLGLTMNEEGKNPEVGQFPQMSMDPHLAMYRQLAQNLCAAVNLPMSSVGIFGDNPASAEAMQAAEYALSDEAEYQWGIFRPALRRLAEDIVMVRDHLAAPPEDSWQLGVKWVSPRYVSPQAASDFIVKVVGAIPKVADTNVALRHAGFSPEEIMEINSQQDREEGARLLARIIGDEEKPEEPQQPTALVEPVGVGGD